MSLLLRVMSLDKVVKYIDFPSADQNQRNRLKLGDILRYWERRIYKPSASLVLNFKSITLKGSSTFHKYVFYILVKTWIYFLLKYIYD